MRVWYLNRCQAATRLQALFRGYRQRRHLLMTHGIPPLISPPQSVSTIRLCLQRRETALVLLQHEVREWLKRRRRKKEHVAAVTRCQALVRGFLVRARIAKQRQWLVEMLQASARAFLALQRVDGRRREKAIQLEGERRAAAALKIQAVWRAHCCRRR